MEAPSTHARDTIETGRSAMKSLKLGLISIALTAGWATAQGQPQGLLPSLTGPYSVGRASLQWSDESRPDAASPDGHRQLVVWLWYPAANTQKQPPAAWQPDKWGELYWTRFLRSHPDFAALGTRYPVQSILSHSYANVPPLPGRQVFPLLLFTPGGGELPLNYASLIEDLASYGYIVVGIVPAHSGSCVYSDGRIVDLPSRTRFDESAAVADLTFTLNEFEKLPAKSPWKNRIDFTHIGAFGHSLGGGASLDIAKTDARVRAAVAIDAGDPTGLAKPILYLHAAGDQLTTLPPDAIGEIRQQTQLFLQTARPGYDLWIKGARHSISTDHFMLPYLPKTIEMAGTIEPTRAITIARVLILSFFDQYLKGMKPVVPISPSPGFPEVVLVGDPDPKPENSTKGNWSTLGLKALPDSKRGGEDAQEGTQRGTDRGGAATGRNGRESGRDLPEAVDQPGNVLWLEEALRWLGDHRVAGTAAAPGREWPAEALGGGLIAGPADPAGDCVKKAVKPRARSKLAGWAKQAYQISERRAARLLRMDRSSHRYQSRRDPQDALRRRLKELAATYVRWGYRRLSVLLRREGWKVNAKRVYRIYVEEELTVRTKVRKKIARRQRTPAPVAVRANQCWSMDFVSDKLADGRAFRVLTVVDQFTRECICLTGDRSMSGAKVVEALGMAIGEYGQAPESITVDNGTEFTGRALEVWAIQQGVRLDFIRPGRPVENSYIESFNGRLRDEFLNVEWFTSLTEARRRLAAWRQDYNHHRPHSALSDRTPTEFASLHRSGAQQRFALSTIHRASGSGCQGSAAPALAALDTRSRLPKIDLDKGEALVRIARETGDSLSSLWSAWKARFTGSGEL
jgi:putative transposase